MNQRPSWEGKVFSAGQRITCNLSNTYLHYCVQKSPTLVSILNWVNPLKVHSSYFHKIRFHILLQHKRSYSKWTLPFTFPYQSPVRISVFTIGLSKGTDMHWK